MNLAEPTSMTCNASANGDDGEPRSRSRCEVPFVDSSIGRSDLVDGHVIAPDDSECTNVRPTTSARQLIGSCIGIGLPFIGILTAMIVSWHTGWFDWTQLTILVVGYVLTGLGITVGYHRMLTHRSFSTYPWMRAFWMIMGAMTVQMSPLNWCAVHRKHHALSDQPGDPHTPHESGVGFINSCRGFWYAHVGWLFTGHMITTDQRRYVPDLLQDPIAVFVHRTWEPLWFPLAFLLPTGAAWAATGTWQGALMGFLWGGCARIFLVQHVTFSTNSICHLFGRRDYRADDESRNNFVCGIFSGGEGFHNNHHAFPTSARHGLEWWQPDISYYLIRLMEVAGLAWDVKRPTAEMRRSKMLS